MGHRPAHGGGTQRERATVINSVMAVVTGGARPAGCPSASAGPVELDMSNCNRPEAVFDAHR